ncbi:MAG: phosphate ABC transporter substrate-binding protein [Desulfovibrionaceae bacterium]|nr:phosphate ABC transporter substrate-binding protein [Desulfovibrionaceae bacterium]
MSLGKIIACTVLSLAMAAPAMAGQLVINGSTTVLPVMQKAGEAFMASHPDIQLSISGGGSGNGIKALIEGQCAVAMSSREMKDKEVKAAEAKGVKPWPVAIAYDAIVPVVHPKNPVKNLTTAQLRDIYSGKINNWKELGGRDGKIVVVSRDTSSGTFECWNELVMRGERVKPAALMQASNGTVIQAIAKNPNAIGYVGLGYLNDSVHGVTVDGKEPTPANAISKVWPVSRELLIFTNGEPAGEVKQLVDFLLDPAKGQKSVLEIGYVPLPTK